MQVAGQGFRVKEAELVLGNLRSEALGGRGRRGDRGQVLGGRGSGESMGKASDD